MDCCELSTSCFNEVFFCRTGCFRLLRKLLYSTQSQNIQLNFILILHVWVVLPTCKSTYYLHACCPQRPDKGDGSCGTGATGSYEMPSRPWDPNPGHVEEQAVLLTAKLYLWPI